MLHGSSTTPSMPGVSSASCMACSKVRSAMGRLAVLRSAPAAATEVNSGSQQRPLSLRSVHKARPSAFSAGMGCSIHGAGAPCAESAVCSGTSTWVSSSSA